MLNVKRTVRKELSFLLIVACRVSFDQLEPYFFLAFLNTFLLALFVRFSCRAFAFASFRLGLSLTRSR